MKNFSELLEQLRETQKISKKDLAQRAKLTPGYISLLTRGEREAPSQTAVNALADALSLDGETRDQFFETAGYSSNPTLFTYAVAPSLLNDESAYRNNKKMDDGGEAPEVDGFHGRKEELVQLEQWVLDDHCRLVTILGIGGAGKTALAAKLETQIEDNFEYIFWRSLQSAPPLKSFLEKCILLVSNQRRIDLPSSEDEQISVLITYLRAHRCLLVLDNFESVLQPNDRAGQYRERYDGYGKLLRRLGETEHRSCLLITSREKPKEVPRLEGIALPVRSMELLGIDRAEAKEILRHEGIEGTDDTWEKFINLYAGNPLALKLVSAFIREWFSGDIAWFLQDGEAVFGDIHDLLDQQFLRLSHLEQQIMYWLAIEGEPVSVNDLRENFVPLVSRKDLQESLDSLRRRSMIGTIEHGRVSLQPAIRQYVTDRFVKEVCKEIDTQSPRLFESHSLIKGQAKDYVRDGQIRLILDPVVEHLLITYGKEKSEQYLKNIVAALQQKRTQAPTPGYTAGNVLNLLIRLHCDLRGSDFSYLAVWQAYLQGVSLPDINLAHTNLSRSIFTDTFGSILSVTLSLNGEMLAVGTANGEVRLWSATSGTSLLTYQGHSDCVRSVAFSLDGRMLASGSDDQTIRLWDVNSGQCLHVLNGHTGWVWSVAFSPDSTLLVSGSEDQDVRLWDVNSGQCLHVLNGHTSRVYSAAFSSDGQMLASGSEDQTVRLWDVNAGSILKTLKGHSSWVWSVSFNSHGQMLASGSDDQTVRLWDTQTGQCLQVLNGHTNRVRSVAFSPDGHILASGSEDQTIRLWDVNTGQYIKTFQGHSSRVRSVAFSGGHTLASGSDDQTVRLWDVNSGQCLRTLEGHTQRVKSVAFSPDGRMLASGSEDQIIYLWDVNTGQYLHALQGHSSWVRSVAFGPDGRMLASGSEDQTVRLWNASSGECAHVLRGHTHRVKSVAFSPDGRMLASGSEDQTVRLWNASSGECAHVLQGHSSRIWSVAFSPDGQTLASGSDDLAVLLWDVSTGKRLQTLQGHIQRVYSVAFSPDGNLLASASGDQTVRLWDVSTGQYLHILRAQSNSSIYSVAFSPDGSLLASSSDDQSVYLWDVSTGQCLKILHEHNSSIYSVAFSPDGSLLASGSDDGTTKLWDADTGVCLRTLRGDRPYERMNVTGVTGLTSSQKEMLQALGAVEDHKRQ